MASIILVTANNCDFPSTNFAQRLEMNTSERDLVASFDGAIAQSIISKSIAVSGITTPLSITLFLCFPTATTGSAVFEVSVMAVAGGAAINLITTISYDAINGSGAINAPASVGNPVRVTFALPNNDAIAPLNYAKFKITRNPADVNDTISTPCYLIAALIEDAR